MRPLIFSVILLLLPSVEVRTEDLIKILPPPTAMASDGWLAFGDLRGYLEPCGCDPRTDMGGLRRLASALARERALNPSLTVFHLGNALAPAGGDEKLARRKTPFLMDGVAKLEPTASLFNILELQRRKEFRGGVRFVLSNAKVRGLPIQEVIETPELAIFGYVYDARDTKTKALLSPASDKSFFDKFMAKVKRQKGKRKVLLFSGSDGDLARLQGAFDVVISSNSAPLSESPSAKEREQPGRLLRKGWSMVPLGGQGLLRGGSAQLREALPLKNVMASPNTQPVRVLVTWLDRDQEDAPQLMADVFKRYDEASKQAMTENLAEKLADLKTSPYVGAEACKSCHAAAYEVWQKSSHAHAYATLQKKEKHQDPECVSCHVLQQKGGFVSLEHSPQFANIQCEVCHGPRKAHAANPSVKVHFKAKEVCTSCHHPPHSSQFVFAEYWGKILHR